jgi:hypothetical protein
LTELNKLRRRSHEKKKEDQDRADVQQDPNVFIPDADADLPPPEQAAILQRRNTKSIERDIIRLLLLFGNQAIPVDGENELGEKEEHLVPIAEYLLHEIEVDDIHFSFELFTKIFEEFKTEHERNALPDINYFLHHQDDDIRSVAVDLIASPHAVHQWELELFLSRHERGVTSAPAPHKLHDWERHFIYPQKEDMQLKRAAIDLIHKLKLRHLELLILEKQQLLKVGVELKDESIIMQTLTEMQALNEAKAFFAKALGQIVIH